MLIYWEPVRHSLCSGVPGRGSVGREGKYIVMVGVSFDKEFYVFFPYYLGAENPQ